MYDIKYMKKQIFLTSIYISTCVSKNNFFYSKYVENFRFVFIGFMVWCNAVAHYIDVCGNGKYIYNTRMHHREDCYY